MDIMNMTFRELGTYYRKVYKDYQKNPSEENEDKLDIGKLFKEHNESSPLIFNWTPSTILARIVLRDNGYGLNDVYLPLVGYGRLPGDNQRLEQDKDWDLDSTIQDVYDIYYQRYIISQAKLELLKNEIDNLIDEIGIPKKDILNYMINFIHKNSNFGTQMFDSAYMSGVVKLNDYFLKEFTYYVSDAWEVEEYQKQPIMDLANIIVGKSYRELANLGYTNLRGEII